MNRTPIARRRIGYLGSCGTEYCGSVEGYFCVRCRHYVSSCRCGDNRGGCSCPDDRFWAGEGERAVTKKLLEVAK